MPFAQKCDLFTHILHNSKCRHFNVRLKAKDVAKKDKMEKIVWKKISSNETKNGRLSPFSKMSLFDLVVFVRCVLPAAVTHSNVRIVASDKHLTTLGDYASLTVDTGVDNSFFTAGAYRFDL